MTTATLTRVPAVRAARTTAPATTTRPIARVINAVAEFIYDGREPVDLDALDFARYAA